jgi:hypothetical protein
MTEKGLHLDILHLELLENGLSVRDLEITRVGVNNSALSGLASRRILSPHVFEKLNQLHEPCR